MLKKDLIWLCLLHLLTAKDLYGYEILNQIHESFPDTQESAIYAELRGMCRNGYTEQYQGQTSGGPTRKYYCLTESGKQKYIDLLGEWRHLRDTLTGMGIE